MQIWGLSIAQKIWQIIFSDLAVQIRLNDI